MRMLTLITCATLTATIAAAVPLSAQMPEQPPRGLALRSCTPVADPAANRFSFRMEFFRSPRINGRAPFDLIWASSSPLRTADRRLGCFVLA